MPVRPFVRALLAACLLTVAATATATAAGAEAPAVSVRCSPHALPADEDGAWKFLVSIRNDWGLGVYGDSVMLDVVPPAPAPPSTVRLNLPAATAPIGAGDSLEAQVTIGASAASARLVVRYYAHPGEGAPFVVADTILASGSVLDDRYPATLARVGGKAVEMVKVPAAEGLGTGAAVLVLPGELAEARDLLVAAARMAAQGTNVVLVNAPGRGRSQGPLDLEGATAKAGALAAFDTLLRMPGTDPARVGVWGVSLGGTLALRLAIDKPAAFRAVASQSARYDALPPKAAAALKGWVLVLHGERDTVFPAAGAHAFADAVKAAGGTVLPKFLPNGQHSLPTVEPTRFLQSRLAAAP